MENDQQTEVIRPLEDECELGRVNYNSNDAFTEDNMNFYSDNIETFYEGDLDDEEQDADDIFPDVRVQEVDVEESPTPARDSFPQPGVPLGARTTTVTSFSSLFHNNYTPAWLTKLKSIIHPSVGSAGEEGDDGSIPNYRFTPILSGIFIPFSILLAIPGLTEHWYIRTLGTKIVEIRQNPVLLDVALGVSMTCALVANIALIFRFLEKRVERMTLICVIFLTIHGHQLFLRVNFVTENVPRCNKYLHRDCFRGHTPF